MAQDAGSPPPRKRRRSAPLRPEAQARADARAQASREREHARGRMSLTPDGKPYRWEPFKPGNEMTLVHGAGSRGKLNLSRRGLELAERISSELLAGAEVPEYLLWPQFRAQVEWWAKIEAKAALLASWLDTLDLDEQVTPKKAGGESPMSVWLAAERAAERARDKLGLTPASWAKIQRDLGLAHKAEEDRLSVAAQAGAEIRARRQRTVVVEADRDEDGD